MTESEIDNIFHNIKIIIENNHKLIEFVKNFHANPSDEFIIQARDLLKEIGE